MAIFSNAPDDITESRPQGLYLVVKVIFLAEFHHVGLCLDEVVTRHCREEAVYSGGHGERMSEQRRKVLQREETGEDSDRLTGAQFGS